MRRRDGRRARVIANDLAEASIDDAVETGGRYGWSCVRQCRRRRVALRVDAGVIKRAFYHCPAI